jgi:hypothetical protein
MPQHQLAHSLQSRVSSAEWQMRVELAAAYRFVANLRRFRNGRPLLNHVDQQSSY